jgi:hypothetical protein
MRKTRGYEGKFEMSVVNIRQPRNQRVVDVLEEMLKLARAGQLQSLAYVAQVQGEERQLFGVLGTYETATGPAITAARRLRDNLEALIDSRDQYQRNPVTRATG